MKRQKELSEVREVIEEAKMDGCFCYSQLINITILYVACQLKNSHSYKI